MIYWRVILLLGCFSLVVLHTAAGAPDDLADYRYSGDDLGAVYSSKATVIKVWAPTARTVRVLLFDDPAIQSYRVVPMARDAAGIWAATLDGDMDGKYYLYEITQLPPGARQPFIYQVNDPYARGCSANSGRTLIYDPKKTNPEGWDEDHFVALKNNVDAVLYETHVRDFTIKKNSGVSDAHRGKYLGMVEEGTRTPEGEKSGLDHLKELGITHVHLMPVFDYAAGDDRQKVDDYTWYDWGYDPVLYNTPEGAYASDSDGTARQKEFKQMVQGFHKNHIGVVMDVVYNHTSATGAGAMSIFDKVVPRYYYRMDRNGGYANATGCGNEFASEKPMARKFIVDSIKYWMTEYHVDGFRFDLMGIIDRDTMLEAWREAKKINPSAIFYGEGWQMEGVPPPERMMTQTHVAGTGIAAFNDGIRDNLKGDYANQRAVGFVQGGAPQYGGMERFLLNIKGQSTGRDAESIPVFSPNETINYDSVHDDLCLWDKLTVSAPAAPEVVRADMDKLAVGILLTSQGVPFIHSGDEFLRSKSLNSDSYNNNDPQVNPIDWSLKTKHKDVFNFYQGMITLRRAHPAFRMTDRASVNRAFESVDVMPENVVEFVLRNHANGDSWRTIMVIYNGSKFGYSRAIKGKWSIVANDKSAGTDTLETRETVMDMESIDVAPFSLVVAHSEGPQHFPSIP